MLFKEVSVSCFSSWKIYSCEKGAVMSTSNRISSDFFCFVFSLRDVDQARNVLSILNKVQRRYLAKLGKDILRGDLKLTRSQHHNFFASRNFIRRLASGRIRRRDLVKNFKIVKKIFSIKYEQDQKNGSSSNRCMGKSKKDMYKFRTDRGEDTDSSSSTLHNSTDEWEEHGECNDNSFRHQGRGSPHYERREGESEGQSQDESERAYEGQHEDEGEEAHWKEEIKTT